MRTFAFKPTFFALLATLVFSATITYGQKGFSKLPSSKDSTYGYTAQNPLKMKKGNQSKSIDNSYKFLAGLKTHDNQSLTLLSRRSAKNPAYQEPTIQINNRYSGRPISGNLGMLDKYDFLTSGTKDTVTLFVDIYNKGTLFIPVGLKYEQK